LKSIVNQRNLESEIAELKSRNQMLQAQLLQAQKQSALGELVGTTTHEFNNVLMTILNYAKMGLRHQDAETRNKAFEKILAAGQRAARMTNSILAMARNRSDQMEPTDLRRIIEDTLFLLERELQKYRINIELDLPEVPLAIANGNQIQQVVMNILINARQAMSGGGRIVIRLIHDASSQTVDISIRDYGPGIPENRLPKLFQPYYTTKAGPDETGKGGTGLGLFACRQIIEAHRGRVRVESTVGQGTCFTIKLPVAATISGTPVSALPKSIPQSPATRLI
jgi:two-component system, NtrC family, sensor kinase